MNDWLIHIQNRLFQPIETILRKRLSDDLNAFTPIWIIGAPRSGTTLAYQLFCSAFNGAYLTNRVAKRYRIALLARNWERTFINESLTPNSFQSEYGNTEQPGDPHEGGQFFYQFFTNTEQPDFRSDQRLNDFQKIIPALASPHSVFISKNTIHSLRIASLQKAFPHSRFVWIERDPVASAWSVYRKREKMNGDWFGIQPPVWKNHLSNPLEEQCLWQFQQTNEIISRDLTKAQAKFIKISYEDLCSNPDQKIRQMAEKLNIVDHLKKPLDLPESFTISTPPENHITRKLKELLSESL